MFGWLLQQQRIGLHARQTLPGRRFDAFGAERRKQREDARQHGAHAHALADQPPRAGKHQQAADDLAARFASR